MKQTNHNYVGNSQRKRVRLRPSPEHPSKRCTNRSGITLLLFGAVGVTLLCASFGSGSQHTNHQSRRLPAVSAAEPGTTVISVLGGKKVKNKPTDACTKLKQFGADIIEKGYSMLGGVTTSQVKTPPKIPPSIYRLRANVGRRAFKLCKLRKSINDMILYPVLTSGNKGADLNYLKFLDKSDIIELYKAIHKLVGREKFCRQFHEDRYIGYIKDHYAEAANVIQWQLKLKSFEKVTVLRKGTCGVINGLSIVRAELLWLKKDNKNYVLKKVHKLKPAEEAELAKYESNIRRIKSERLRKQLRTDKISHLKDKRFEYEQEKSGVKIQQALQKTSPFVNQIVGRYETKDYLYILMEKGIDMTHFLMQNPMKEEIAKFYLANLILAIEKFQTHGKPKAHRDLKPENLLMNADGYLQVIDCAHFGEFDEKGRLKGVLGTLYYNPPEVIEADAVDGYYEGKLPDPWAFGIIMVQMLTGCLPFLDGNNNFSITLNKKGFNIKQINEDPVCRDLSPLAKDLISKLLNGNRKERLVEPCEIMKHPWFGFSLEDWRKLAHKEIAAPCIPPSEHPTNPNQFLRPKWNVRWTKQLPSRRMQAHT